MPPTRARPPVDGIVVGLPTSLFFVTTERRTPWRSPPARSLFSRDDEIDLRERPPDAIDLDDIDLTD